MSLQVLFRFCGGDDTLEWRNEKRKWTMWQECSFVSCISLLEFVVVKKCWPAQRGTKAYAVYNHPTIRLISNQRVWRVTSAMNSRCWEMHLSVQVMAAPSNRHIFYWQTHSGFSDCLLSWPDSSSVYLPSYVPCFLMDVNDCTAKHTRDIP